MFKSILKKIFLSAAAFIPIIAHSQVKAAYQPAAFTDAHRLEKIQKLLPQINKMYEAWAATNHIPGFAFGIMLDGVLIYTGSGGYSDLQKKIPATIKTNFRIASMTKSFTAMAILQLRDANKLRLDDPAYLYVPELKNQKLTKDTPDITVRDLLTQASGLPQDDPWADRNLQNSDADLISFLKSGISFSTSTGTSFEYSNLAFAILGLIIKNVSGMTYQDYITTHIWKPLGMQQSAWEFTEVPTVQLARGYRWIYDNWREEELLHDGSFGAMGGMITSVEAFSRYVALHQLAWPPRDDRENNIIRRSTVREMHQPWKLGELKLSLNSNSAEQATLAAYGNGLRWLKSSDGKIFVGHSGGLPGFGSNWFIMPDFGIGVILFANRTYANAADINLKVLNTLLKEATLTPRRLPVSKILHIRKKSLLKFLPDWKNATYNNIFAKNFFLDNDIDLLRQQTQEMYQKIGKITAITDLIPENQLRGYFIVKGEKNNLKISFTLSPEKKPLIQYFNIEFG